MTNKNITPVTDIMYKRELKKRREGTPNIIDRYCSLAKSYGISGDQNIYWFGLAHELHFQLLNIMSEE